MPSPFELIGFGPHGWAPVLLAGASLTVIISVCGFTLGMVLSGLVVVARLSGVRALVFLAWAYTTVLRGVPELLVLYLLFFGGTAAISAISHAVGGGFAGAPAAVTGIAALALIAAAYAAEVLRGAWGGIASGQWDAARALGLGRFLAVRRVIAPQVLRLALPGLGNVWQLVLKESALISLTGLAELMRQSAVAANATSQPFLFYGTAAGLYLIMTTASTRVFAFAEVRSRRGDGRG